MPSSGKRYRRALVWMRRGLRLQDHAPLWQALQSADEVIPVVCVRAEPRHFNGSARSAFVGSALATLDAGLRKAGSHLTIRLGKPVDEIPATAAAYRADVVFAASVCDAPTLGRDALLAAVLRKQKVDWTPVQDSVIFGGREILNGSEEPYRMFTPYKRAWLARADEFPPPLRRAGRLKTPPPLPSSISVEEIPGFVRPAFPGGENLARMVLKQFVTKKLFTYLNNRDFPALNGTSLLSCHLSHGTISVREVYRAVQDAAEGAGNRGRESAQFFISELIWREFYYQVMSNFPHVAEHAFKQEFDALSWTKNERLFSTWCSGATGYPLVDAAMRQLNAEGWMHNRARMVVASFLTKDLHIDWRRGEQYFMDRLIDGDIASNNGGWQWCAGTGTDASPWFRIFNPVAQGKRYDPEGTYIRRYVPELSRLPVPAIHAPWRLSLAQQKEFDCLLGKNYPFPVVDHDEQRKISMELYRTPVL